MMSRAEIGDQIATAVTTAVQAVIAPPAAAGGLMDIWARLGPLTPSWDPAALWKPAEASPGVPALLENLPLLRGLFLSATAHPVLHVLFHLALAVVFTYSFSWLFWLGISIVLTVLQLLYALYQLIRVSIDLAAMSTLKFWMGLWGLCSRLWRPHLTNRKDKISSQSRCLADFERLSAADNDAEGRAVHEWKESTKDIAAASVLEKTTEKLRLARHKGDFHDLQFLLSGLLKRDHLGITDEALHQRCVTGTKFVVEAFQSEVEKCLKALVHHPTMPLEQKLAFFKAERRSLGQTALCLSGGGSICMYHMGIMKALIEAGIYKNIRVLSGTSGGSIAAAMVACKTDAEMLTQVIHPKVSTDYRHDGAQLKEGIRWFPPLRDQLIHFVKKRVLMDSGEFKRCCDWYYGDCTFAEGYAKTKRHVSITVSYSASHSSSSATPARLLLNHISSPHVTLASAVAASCALPGIMRAQPLEAKDRSGKVVKLDHDGVHGYVDGSLAADLPFKRIATLFNVSNFLVSQVNFHVRPFLRKQHSETSRYWSIVTYLEQDIRHRATRLARLGLLPTFFGQSMSGVFKQKYHGDVTMTPDFTTKESVGLSAVLNPTVADMEHYISGGERAAWPHINRIRFMMRTEVCLRECVVCLQETLLRRPVDQRGASHVAQLASLKSVASLDRLEEASPCNSPVGGRAQSALGGALGGALSALGGPSPDWGRTRLGSGGQRSRVRADTHEFGLFDDDLDLSQLHDPSAGLASVGRQPSSELAEELGRVKAENARLRARLASIAALADATADLAPPAARSAPMFAPAPDAPLAGAMDRGVGPEVLKF